MKRTWLILVFMVVLLLAVSVPAPVLAQEGEPASNVPDLMLFTQYPSQVVGLDEPVTLPLTLRTGLAGQPVELEVQDLPEKWVASFRGNNRIVSAVYVQPDSDATVDLRIELPADVEPGTYGFTVVASANRAEATLPIELTVQEKVPASLAFEADLPTVRAQPDSTFRYNVTLQNEGDEDLTVELLSQAPEGFEVTFNSSGQEVTSIPVAANSSERLSIEADPLLDVPTGTYPFTIQARGGDVEASLELVAEVIGQAELALTTPDGRLSGQAQAGEQTSFSLWLQNTGSAPVRGIKMSATEPNGWNVTFEPEQVAEIAPGQQVEVTARVQPAERALAGDYIVTFRAQPDGLSAESIEYRVTVRTSTLWGITGVALVAVAVGVVGVAVMRFGRR